MFLLTFSGSLRGEHRWWFSVTLWQQEMGLFAILDFSLIENKEWTLSAQFRGPPMG